ncbi:MAG: hypothetical protein H7268_16370 [Sandarakinorhabdus sp.]|nr:hypothetical protein [Sandarakinorhabdus sp.]
MLRRHLGLLAMVFAASPALAAPNTAAFLRACEPRVPVASCGCMAGELAQGRTGQIALDAFRVIELPENQRQSAAVALANKYGAKLSEIKSVIDGSENLMNQAYERCK